MTGPRLHLTLLIALGIILIWSAINPHDFFTWILEVFPAIIGAALLVRTYGKFRFTDLVYVLIFIHCVILIIGGHYTYSEMPLFNWIRDEFHLSRNHYDRLGHLAQGFIPAMVARELLLRKSPLVRGKWLFFIVLSVCMFISSTYELIEWAVAEWSGTKAEAFLAMQGDVWDTQKDMALALVGATLAQITIAGLHDKQLRKIA